MEFIHIYKYNEITYAWNVLLQIEKIQFIVIDIETN